MRYAIVESGGKQYRAVEGVTLEVDRLPVDAGKKYELERVLLMADGDEVMVGTPAVSGIHVKATVVDHFRGPKVVSFRYAPKKRIRVKGGHRQQYTRLLIDFIGRPGEERKIEKAEVKKALKVETPAKGSKKGAGEPSIKKTVKAKSPARKSTSTRKSTKK
jgi:large subunit ribosomal protein L21